MEVFQPYIIAFLAGFIPVMLWLWFLEHEDKNPEPKKVTLLAFIAGILTVFAIIPVQYLITVLFGTSLSGDQPSIIIILWAASEEIGKFLVAYFLVLRRIENDEPIDSLMYLITTALGFAALENALYLLSPLRNGDVVQAVVTGNFRFIGATLLHVVSSSIIGVALAFSYYKSATIRRMHLIIGLIGATLLHTFFNFSIIIDEGSKAIISFFTVWIALIILLLVFEKIKQIKKPIN
jgi:protease PrsW